MSSVNCKFIAKYKIKKIESGTLKEVINFLDNAEEFCVDIETTGLCPHKSKITMLQIGNVEQQFVIDARDYDISFINPYLTGTKIKIGTNLKFEYKMFLGNLRVRMQTISDIMLNEMVIECGRKQFGFSLAHLTKKYLDITLNKTTAVSFLIQGDKPFSYEQVIYGALDVYYPDLILKKQREIIKKENLDVVIRLENNAVKSMAEIEFCGMPVNTSKWAELALINEKMAIAKREELDSFIINSGVSKYVVEKNLFNNTPYCFIDWDSPKVVAKVFKDLGIPIQIIDKDRTKKVFEEFGIDRDFYRDSVGGPELKQYSEEFPIIPIFIDYQKYRKASTAFGSNWLTENINETTGRVHTNIWQILSTGRSSSSKPNVQQIPSFKDPSKPSYQAHRTCFEVPEGWKFIVRDYSGQELRILADRSDEDSMINEFIHGSGDIHSLTASKVYSKIRGTPVKVSSKENKDLRQNGKTLNFAIAYGAGAYKISKNLGISANEAQEIIDSLYEAFPKLSGYFKEGHKFVDRNGYIVIDPFTNRRSYFSFFDKYQKLSEEIKEKKRNKDNITKIEWSNLFTMKGIMERASQNYRIQGLAASMTKAALILFYNYLLENSLFDSVQIILVLHDEIVILAKDEIAEKIDSVLAECMVNAGKLFCKKIPMDVSGGTCTVWDH